MWSTYLTLHVFGLEADPMNKIRSSGVFQFEALLSEGFFFVLWFQFYGIFSSAYQHLKSQIMECAPGTKLNMVESGAMKVDCLGLSKFNSNPIASKTNRRVPFS